MCISSNKLVKGEQKLEEDTFNLKSVLSIVPSDLAGTGAHSRLKARVEPGSVSARPKLLGFQIPNTENADDIEQQQSMADTLSHRVSGTVDWVLYLDHHILFDDAYFRTKRVAEALLLLEIVCPLASPLSLSLCLSLSLSHSCSLLPSHT